MPRALLGSVGAFLAITVVVAASRAPAQVPAPKIQSPQAAGQRDGFNRLEEMKVELALLEDPTLFPYSLAASLHGDFLQLYGFVPNDRLRQRALDVARRSTSVTVHEALGLRSDVKLQSSPRPADVLQKEGSALLQTELAEKVQKVSLEVRADSMAVLTGCIDSVENKLKASQVLRRLSGCGGVVNKLTVEEIVRGGQKMVRVMHDDSLFVSPPALGLNPKPRTAPPPPAIQLISNPNAKKSESSLPPFVPSKQESPRLKPVPAKIDKSAELFAPSKLPVKWGRPTSGWQTQVKDLQALQAARQQNLMPTPLETPNRPAEPAKAPVRMAESRPSRPNIVPRPSFAETRPAPVMSWRRPGGAEESEPQSQSPRMAPDAAAGTLPSLRSSRRWPPAYVMGPPPSQGRPGVVVFEDDPPQPKPAMAATTTSRPVVPADLQRQVKLLCGRDAREVAVSMQLDGSVLVKVKVANRSIEDRLSRKILALPEMSAPRVRLMMEIGP